MKPENFFWLVGLLEGEGSFSALKNNQVDLHYYPCVSIWMTDLDVIERVRKLLKSHEKIIVRKSHKYEGAKPVYQTRVRGEQAAVWMRILRPWMGERRKAQIDKTLKAWQDWHDSTEQRQDADSRRKLKWAEIREIRRLYGTGKITRLMLSKTFQVYSSTIGDILAHRTWRET